MKNFDFYNVKIEPFTPLSLKRSVMGVVTRTHSNYVGKLFYISKMYCQYFYVIYWAFA